jgi:adenosine deaminase
MVEINLTSNDVILGVRGADHPLRAYLAAGVPVALSTDDEGVARSEITMEYVRAAHDQGLSYPVLKNMARTSLQYAFAADTTKARLQRGLEAAFRSFETRYGGMVVPSRDNAPLTP